MKELVSTYVIMLLEVTYSLLRVIVFAVLMFVAFGLAFYILIGEINQYSTPGRGHVYSAGLYGGRD